jgi:retron-type reverse transcriptase
MSLWAAVKRWWRDVTAGKGHGVSELARRLGWFPLELETFQPTYREFTIPKANGKPRQLAAPEPPLKALQRTILRRLLAKLKVYPTAKGFEKGQSIVTNALPHRGRAVVLKMDLQDFFPSTTRRRVYKFFRGIGWNRHAAEYLTKFTTHQGGLPQGAPTSPRLSNLVNYKLDLRIARLAARFGLTYTRYADDVTISFPEDDRNRIRYVVRRVRRIVRDEGGYKVHARKKLRVLRRHQRQCVTGLVVNDKVQLPRATRRWLRAVQHHLRTGRAATLTKEQLAGWQALQHMIAQQTAAKS